MSYVLNIWRQSGDHPLPDTPVGIWAMLPELHACRPVAENGRFKILSAAVQEALPELKRPDADEGPVWIDGLEADHAVTVLNLGLYCDDDDRFTSVRQLIIEHANRLGLHVADEQAAELFLADGRMYRLQRLVKEGRPPLVADTEADEVLDLLRRAKSGESSARVDLGGRYMLGEGVRQNAQMAVHWWSLAAHDGYPTAQYNLACSLMEGEGIDKNEAAALKWFALAAQGGHADAVFNLSVMYAQGIATPIDAVASRALRMLAAQRGSPRVDNRHEFGEGEFAGVLQLASQLSEQGRLCEVLAQRRIERQVAEAAERAKSPRRVDAGKTHTRTPSHRPKVSGHRWHAGHLALVVGATSFVLALMLVPLLPAPWRLLPLALLGIVGAWGVWRVSAEMQSSTALRVVTTVLALVPVLSMVVCGAWLWRVLRRR